MTDDELDLLASAYVDGEATPEEVAMVERDPGLQARVEAFRAVEVDGSITPPPGLIDRHLAAAMAEFESAAPVVDLREAAARRRDAGTGAAAAGRARTKPARTMPSWMAAAAGLVIIGGGLAWALGQSSGGDDADSEETASIAADDSSGDDAAEASSFEADEEEEGDAAMAAMSDEAMEESDDAMEEDASDDGDQGRSVDTESAPAPADSDESAEDDDDAGDAEQELVEPEPLLFFDEVPDVDAIGVLPDPETDLERSLCGPEIVTATLGEYIGFIPVLVGSQQAEIYLFQDGDGAEIRLLIDETCQPLEP